MDKLRSHGDQEIGRQQNDGQIPDSMRIDLQDHLVTRNSVASGNGSYRSLWKNGPFTADENDNSDADVPSQTTIVTIVSLPEGKWVMLTQLSLE